MYETNGATLKMLMSDKEFSGKYGKEYNETMEKAQFFINNPKKLIEKAQTETPKNNLRLIAPFVDKFSHDMTYFKGFVKYPHRLKNYIVSKNEAYSTTRSYLPTIMDLEPNSTCNFKCIMCQVSNWKNGKRADDMPFEEFKTFCDGNNHFTEVKLHGMGEPLLHNKYFDMVEYLSSQHIWTRTSINGSLLHVKNNHKNLIDAGIGEIQCSFDGATKEIYEKIRVNSNFERIVKNFTLLNHYANTKDRPFTRMWALIQKANRHQIFDFVKLAFKMNFKRLSFSVSLNDWGREAWNQSNKQLQINKFTPEEHAKLIKLSKAHDIDITLWEQGSRYSTESKEKLCSWVFNRPYISSDLKVVPCCMIADPDVVNFGDSRDFSNVWNNKNYQNFRQLHIDGKIPNCCKNCYLGLCNE